MAFPSRHRIGQIVTRIVELLVIVNGIASTYRIHFGTRNHLTVVGIELRRIAEYSLVLFHLIRQIGFDDGPFLTFGNFHDNILRT